MKILVTGICGFVGSTLAKALKESNPEYEIFGIDNFVRAGSWLNKEKLDRLSIRVYHGDIRQESDLQLLPKADWVVDAAANPSVLAGVDGRTSSLQLVQNNLLGTIHLLEYCKRYKAGFVLLSTSRVYSIPPVANLALTVVNGGFVPEEDQEFPTGISLKGVGEACSISPPVSLYGSTKVCSEHLAIEYGETFGFPVWINRCGVLAGAGQFGHPGQGIFAYWIHAFNEKKGLKYIGFGGTGYQVRDVLHPRDLVSLLKKQFYGIRNEHDRIVNLSGGVKNSISLKQLTDWCSARFGQNKVVASNEERPFDIGWMVLDNSLARQQWGWSPQTNMEDIFNEIADFSMVNKEWLKMSNS